LTNFLLYLETVQDRTIVTVKDEYELVCDLSNGAISSEFECLLTYGFQGHDILQCHIYRNIVRDRVILRITMADQ